MRCSIPYRAIVCVLAFGVPLGSPRCAEAAPGSSGLPQPLHLRQAIAYALDNNYAVQVAAARVRRQGGAVTHAGRVVPTNPRVNLWAGPRRFADGRIDADIRLIISQELWTAGKRGLGLDAARADRDAAQDQFEFLRMTTAARTRRAFLDVLKAQESVRTAREVLSLTRELQRFVQQRLQAGAGTQLDVNTAVIATGKAEAQLASAKGELGRARVALSEILAVDPGRRVRVAGRLQPVPLHVPDRQRLLDEAVKRRQDLAAAGQSVIAARRRLLLSKRELIPNLTVFGWFKREGNADIITALGVSAPLPVLHRFTGEQKSAQARADEALYKRDAMRLRVRSEVSNALIAYDTARSRVTALSQKVLNAAEDNVRMTRIAFQAGKVGAPAITTAQDNLFSVRHAYLSALSALIKAGTDLERATGGLLRLATGASKHPEENSQ